LSNQGYVAIIHDSGRRIHLLQENNMAIFGIDHGTSSSAAAVLEKLAAQPPS
jgi:hypothetical protein